MPFFIKKYLILAVSLVLFSCSKDEGDAKSGKSSILVTVLSENTPVGEGIIVFTSPSTVTHTTDVYGQVEFKNLDQITYELYSFIDGFGSGKTIVDLGEEAERSKIFIVEGSFITPTVNISSPLDGEGFNKIDTIEFNGFIEDANTPLNELTWEWKSDIDGLLEQGSIDNEGLITFSTNSLSENDHIISLSATNNLGITNTTSISISTLFPQVLDLEITENPDFTKTLNWSILDSDIERYEIYRYTDSDSDEILIATLNNQTTSYIDNSIPFANEVFYFVNAINARENSRSSNTVSSPGVPLFNFNPEQVEINPDEPIVYIKSNEEVFALNYFDMEITMQSDFPGSIGNFHVANNGFGNELYIPSSDGWIYIYDLGNFTYKQSISVGVPVMSVISDNNGLLYTSTDPSPWWDNPLRVFNRNSLSFVDSGGDFSNCSIKLLPSNNEIIELTINISPIDMDYYRFDSNGNFVQHENDSYHGDYPLNPIIFKIAPQNNFLITDEKGVIYSADEHMTFQGYLQGGNFEFSDFEFNENASKIYAGVFTKKLIHVYDGTTFQKIDEIETQGYPYKIFRKGNQLVVVVSPFTFSSYYGPNTFGIELINL